MPGYQHGVVAVISLGPAGACNAHKFVKPDVGKFRLLSTSICLILRNRLTGAQACRRSQL